MNLGFVFNLIVAVATGAGIYTAIRVDLVMAKMRAEQAIEEAGKAHEVAGKAHDKIDNHISNHTK